MQALHTAISIKEMNIPGWRLHPLKGHKEGQGAIQVSGNSRIVFEFVGGDAYVVNYDDNHSLPLQGHPFSPSSSSRVEAM